MRAIARNPVHWRVSRPALQPQLRELRQVLFDDRIRGRAARTQALANDRQPALSMIHNHIETAERDGVAFAHLRTVPGDLAKLAKCVFQRVLVLLGAIHRLKGLVDEHVEEMLPTLRGSFRIATRDMWLGAMRWITDQPSTAAGHRAALESQGPF